jgi:hypothetical protein
LSPEESEIDRRIRELEAYEQIRQLAARYALALDSRDIDELVMLFVEDVEVPDGETGRAALGAWFSTVLKSFNVTFHLIGNHIIDLIDDDHAIGTLYCRAEHEVGESWIVMPMQYWDQYEFRDGTWYISSRTAHAFYAADIMENPTDVPGRFHFPGSPVLTAADLPERWDTWRRFWAADPAGDPS